MHRATAFIIALVFLSLTACGQKGALYFPEQEREVQAEENSSAPNPNTEFEAVQSASDSTQIIETKTDLL